MTRRSFVLSLGAFGAGAALNSAFAQEVAGAPAVSGAGSTFIAPLLARWSRSYERWVAGGGALAVGGGGLDDPPPSVALDYEPVGSLAGMMRAREGGVDFGATEAPMASADLRQLGLIQFPLAIGGVAIVINLDGVAPGALKLTGEMLADIYLGKIQSWKDPAIAALNPGLALPDAKIAVVRRSDGSGTTFNFATYLSKASAQWRERVGADLELPWPVGIGAKGNDGVSQTVRRTKNAIGYVEYGHAVQTKLSFAAIRNAAGVFVAPGAAGFQAGAASAPWSAANDFQLLLTDPPGAEAYPIAATAFAMMRPAASARRTRAALTFFSWAFDHGSPEAAALGYVPLPQALARDVKGYWAKHFNATF